MSGLGDSNRLLTKWAPAHTLIPTDLSERETKATLFLLPAKIDDTRGALYLDESAGLVKTLKAQDEENEFAHGKEDRAYLSEYGAGDLVEYVVASITLGVIGNVTTDILRRIVKAARILVKRRTFGSPGEVERSHVSIEIAKIEENQGARIIEGIKYRGDMAGFERSMDAIMQMLNKEKRGDDSSLGHESAAGENED